MSSNYENSCRWVLDRIEDYLDDDLSSGELKRFQSHVDGCDACARELAFATRVVGELRALPPLSAPGRVTERVAAAVAPPRATFAERLAAWMGEAWSAARRPAMATMILLLLAAGTYVITQRERPQQVSEAQIEEATRETLLAFAYVGKYSRMTGQIIRDQVIDEVVQPVGRAMIETKIIETKPEPGRSDT
jgi:anti-sigma factor RsiW